MRPSDTYAYRVQRAVARGCCIGCWLPNDRLPLIRCSRCKERQAIAMRLNTIAARLAALEIEEAALIARRLELAKEAARRRIAKGTKAGRQPFKSQAQRKAEHKATGQATRQGRETRSSNRLATWKQVTHGEAPQHRPA